MTLAFESRCACPTDYSDLLSLPEPVVIGLVACGGESSERRSVRLQWRNYADFLAGILLGYCSMAAAQTISPEVRAFVKVDAPGGRSDSRASD